jgi:hypothetical protein
MGVWQLLLCTNQLHLFLLVLTPSHPVSSFFNLTFQRAIRLPKLRKPKTDTLTRLSAQEMGGPAAGVYFVPHSQYTAQMMYNLGIGIDKYFPLDHGHTAPYLASLVAQEFVLGLKCGSAPLQDLVVNATSRIESALLGTCVSVNATLPI